MSFVQPLSKKRDQTSWFDQLQYHRMRSAVLEQQTVTAGSTQNLLNIASGSGMVKSVFLAVSGGAGAAQDGDFIVTVDGEGTPSITADLGTFFGLHWATSNQANYTPHVYGEWKTGVEMSGSLVFPIPYSSSITIAYKNNDAGSANIWSIVEYTDSESPPYRLKLATDASADYGSADTITSGSTKTLLDLAAGNSGWLVHHTMVIKGTTNLTMLERDIEIKIDREGSASLTSSGLEDWFGQSFYFFRGNQARSHYFSILESDGGNREFVPMVDLVAKMGGIRFSDGIIVTLGTEGAVTTSHDQTSALLYYLDQP